MAINKSQRTWLTFQPRLLIMRPLADCKSRGLDLDPGPIPYFRGNWSWNNFYRHSPPFHWFKKGCCQLQAKICCSTIIQYKILLATKHSVILMANKVIKWTGFLSKRRNVHSHTAQSMTRLQKIVEPRLTQRQRRVIWIHQKTQNVLKGLVNHLVKLAQEKEVWLGELTVLTCP